MLLSPRRVAAVAAPALALGMTAAAVPAQAADPSEVVIPEIHATYKGPLSSAGKNPSITMKGEEVSRAFIDMTSYKTARKVAKKTDGKADEKGDTVQAKGFDCKARKVKTKNPGTAGEYVVVTWKCHFQAADTPTHIVLKYKQASL